MPRTPREVGKQVHEAVNEQVRDLPIQAARLAMFGVGRALLLADRATRDLKNIRSGEIRPVVGRLMDDAEKITGKIGSRVEDLLAETPVGKVLELVGGGKPAPETTIPVASPPVRASQIAAQAAAAKKKNEIALGKPAPTPVAEPVVEPPAAEEIVDHVVQPVVQPAAEQVVEPVVPPIVEPVTEPVAKKAPKKVAEEIAEPVNVPVEIDAVKATLNTVTLPVPNYEELSHASLRARLRKLTAPEVKQLREYEAAHKSRAEILKMYDNRIAKLSEEA
jgi:hypothetical protein